MESAPRLITSSGHNRVLIDMHHNTVLNERKIIQGRLLVVTSVNQKLTTQNQNR